MKLETVSTDESALRRGRTRRRRLAGMLLIVIVAGGLWGYSAVRERGRQNVITDQVRALLEDLADGRDGMGTSVITSVASAKTAIENLDALLHGTIDAPGQPASASASIAVNRGPGPVSSDGRITHHVVIEFGAAGSLGLNIVFHDDRDRAEIVGYFQPQKRDS